MPPPQPGEIQQQNPVPAVEKAGERVTAEPEKTLKLAGESDGDAIKRLDGKSREEAKTFTETHGNTKVAQFVKTGEATGIKVA